MNGLGLCSSMYVSLFWSPDSSPCCTYSLVILHSFLSLEWLRDSKTSCTCHRMWSAAPGSTMQRCVFASPLWLNEMELYTHFRTRQDTANLLVWPSTKACMQVSHLLSYLSVNILPSFSNCAYYIDHLIPISFTISACHFSHVCHPRC